MKILFTREENVEKKKVEIVERKGIGHPDSLADGIAESISREYCKYSIRKFGCILHHNVDHCTILGGKSKIDFGHYNVIRKIEIVFGGRACYNFQGEEVPIPELSLKAAKGYLKSIGFKEKDIENNFVFTNKIRRGRKKFSFRIYSNNRNNIHDLKINDTSCSTGFYPLSLTEKIALYIENTLNSKKFKKSLPYIGSDIKVMCIRIGKTFRIIVAVPFLSQYVSSLSDYIRKKQEIKEVITEKIKENFEVKSIELYVNTKDIYKNKNPKLYLLGIGTAAEIGDCGAVGRGNRLSGIIPVTRGFEEEAFWGKNPGFYAGKLYNILAYILSEELYELVKTPIGVTIVSKNGDPVVDPYLIIIKSNRKLNTRKKEIEIKIREKLENLDHIIFSLLNLKKTYIFDSEEIYSY